MVLLVLLVLLLLFLLFQVRFGFWSVQWSARVVRLGCGSVRDTPFVLPYGLDWRDLRDRTQNGPTN